MSTSGALDMILQIEPWIDDAELQQLRRVVDSTFLVENKLTKEFEELTSALTGARHAIAVCNGTMGLTACLMALGIGPGDEVIVPNITFVATANAVVLAGATPVLCEITTDTFCIDVERAAHVVTTRTKAIMPVHLYGQTADMVRVMEFAKKHSLKVVEDAAQAVGVRFNGQHAGTFGDLGVLSYYGNKTITCGEGGVVLTNDSDLAKKIYRLKNHGRDVKGTFIHEQVGFNFSFTDLQAAVGIAQMRKFPEIKAKKQAIRDRYERELAGLPGLELVHIDERCEPVHWFTSCLTEDADTLAGFLKDRGIQSRRFFYPLHLQPCYADRRFIRNITDDFRLSEKIFKQGISLPSAHSLTSQQQDKVIEAIASFANAAPGLS